MSIFKNYLRTCVVSHFEELMATIERMPTDLASIPPDHPDYKLREYAEILRRFEHDGIRDVTDDDVGAMLVDAMYQLLPDEIMI